MIAITMSTLPFDLFLLTYLFRFVSYVHFAFWKLISSILFARYRNFLDSIFSERSLVGGWSTLECCLTSTVV